MGFNSGFKGLNMVDTTPNAVCNNSAKGLGILQSTLALYMQYVICLFEDILHTAHSPPWLRKIS